MHEANQTTAKSGTDDFYTAEPENEDDQIWAIIINKSTVISFIILITSYGRLHMEQLAGRRDVSRFTLYFSSPSQETPVLKILSGLYAGHKLTVSGGPSSSTAT